MKEKTSALYSTYIIDGVSRRLTPAEILDDCLDHREESAPEDRDYEPIVDESTDPSPALNSFSGKDVQEYLDRTITLMGVARGCPMSFADPYTKGRIARELIDTMWMRGHFRLGDMTLMAKWKWNSGPLGNMAAFYDSVEAAADYIDSLGICLSGYSFSESDKISGVTFKAAATDRQEDPEDEFDPEDETDLPEAPFGSGHPVIGRRRAVPDKLAADPDSWIIYVPFDSCDFRLGDSILCEALGENGDTYPEIGDADYFMDCFEVVREFVEDKVVVSAATVAEGGLLAALKMMCPEGLGATMDISGIMRAYGEQESTRVLFSEIPGVLIQIKDIDYDYVDAEFLLQDVAYYPLGHPVPGSDNVKVRAGRGGGISAILQSLLSSQASEGED